VSMRWRDFMMQYRKRRLHYGHPHPPIPHLRRQSNRFSGSHGNLIVSASNDDPGRRALERIALTAENAGFIYRGTLGDSLREFRSDAAGMVDERLPLLYGLIETLPGYEFAVINHLLSDECDNRRPGEPFGIVGIEPNFQCRYGLPGMIGSNYDLRAQGSKHDDYCQLLRVRDAYNKGITGSGVTVAVVDSGYEKSGVIAGFRDLWDRANYSEADKVGHGTAMTEIIRDLAPDASVRSVRISEGSAPRLWNAMLGVSVASFEFSAEIINLSLGLSTLIICTGCGQGVSNCSNCGHDLPVISNTLESFLEGIVGVDVKGDGPPIIVSATGNEGSGSVDKPANYDLSVAVGSINESTNRSPFSNYDAAHSDFIVMPGGDEDSHQQPTEWVGEGSSGKCLGTSPATGYATGMLALYLSDTKYRDADRTVFRGNVFANCENCANQSAKEHGKGYLPYKP
jgi:hypothetical protein